ncbi:hypothetical protein [Fibrella forsythiae]|uniref:Uncharacterized protein n=1 Tax=Fibrella forsythiae TaxID=2817061 RepID=A0ABS3JP87_9BACT|nr:hypothetical protein [Fibrella forsythiae]MBO0951798.1 hypothetical protein [Fibrella forsythiae]
MKATTYRQLTSVHLLHRIWHNELELALQEVLFWQELLGTLSEVEHPKAAEAQTWQTEINQLHHFRRLITRLRNDVQTVDQELAMSVRFEHVPAKETRLDHQYLREEMDSFHADFRTFKASIRQFIVTKTTF